MLGANYVYLSPSHALAKNKNKNRCFLTTRIWISGMFPTYRIPLKHCAMWPFKQVMNFWVGHFASGGMIIDELQEVISKSKKWSEASTSLKTNISLPPGCFLSRWFSELPFFCGIWYVSLLEGINFDMWCIKRQFFLVYQKTASRPPFSKHQRNAPKVRCIQFLPPTKNLCSNPVFRNGWASKMVAC